MHDTNWDIHGNELMHDPQAEADADIVAPTLLDSESEGPQAGAAADIVADTLMDSDNEEQHPVAAADSVNVVETRIVAATLIDPGS